MGGTILIKWWRVTYGRLTTIPESIPIDKWQIIKTSVYKGGKKDRRQYLEEKNMYFEVS